MQIRTPVNANLYLTHYCNLGCSFCCYRPFQKGNNKDLSTEQWLKIIDELSDLRVFQIRIPGGEPFVREDLLKILEHIALRNMRFTLNTNGTLMSEQDARFIASLNRADEIRLSVDGMEEKHDEIRGAGNWKRTINAIKFLKKYAVKVHITMVLTTSNYQDCIKTCHFLFDDLQVNSLQINSVSDGFSEISPEQGKVSDEVYARIMKEVIMLKKTYPQITSSFLDMYRQITNPVNREDCRRCTTPWKGVTVRADGAIIACPSAVNHILGWCGKDSIRDVWYNSQTMTDFRQEICTGYELPEKECVNCQYQWYCRQACPPSIHRGAVRCRKKLLNLLNDIL